MTWCEVLDMTQFVFPQNALGGSSHSFAMLLPLPPTRGHLPTQDHGTAARGLPHLCYPQLLSPTLGRSPVGLLCAGGTTTAGWFKSFQGGSTCEELSIQCNKILLPQVLSRSSRFGRIEPPRTGLNHQELMRNCHRILVP